MLLLLLWGLQTPHPHPLWWHQQPLRRVTQPAGHVLAAGL